MPADRDLAMPAGRVKLSAAARRIGLAGFLEWWAGELAPLVPAGTRAAIERRRARPVLAFEGDAIGVWQPVLRDGVLGVDAKARVPLDGDPSSLAAGRAALASIAGSGAPRVVVSMTRPHVLRRTLTLPAAVEENLRQALAYDLDRHTPFRAEDLYFDAVVAGRDAARQEIRVELAAARRTLVDQALATATAMGAEVVAVVPEPPATASSSRLNLLPDADRRIVPFWRRWQFWLPMLLVVAIALTAAALPLWKKREYAIALTRVADEARMQAAVSESLRTELDRLTGDYNFALERKYQFPSNVQALDEVTRLLPDDTWLTQLEIKSVVRAKEPQRELLMRGESANAGRLISAFEASNVFTQAAHRSPTTKIQPGPGEIFDLAAQVRTLPAPAPVTLAAGDAATPAPGAATSASPAAAASPAPANAGAAAAAGAAGRAAPATPASAPHAAAPAANAAAANLPAPNAAAANPPAANAPAPNAAAQPAAGPAPANAAASAPAPSRAAPAPGHTVYPPPTPPTTAPPAPGTIAYPAPVPPPAPGAAPPRPAAPVAPAAPSANPPVPSKSAVRVPGAAS